jgi:peptidoglycan hydrolase CwlO-like protein
MQSNTSATPNAGTPVVASDTPAMKMSPDEFAELRTQATAIGVQDNQLGKMLNSLILHLGHAFGLDPAQEDARIAAKARTDNRAREDAQLKTEASDRAEARAEEDAQPRTPEQATALAATRAAQDKQLQTDADELAATRSEEDAATKGVDNAG